jgi:hypothetical protein
MHVTAAGDRRKTASAILDVSRRPAPTGVVS